MRVRSWSLLAFRSATCWARLGASGLSAALEAVTPQSARVAATVPTTLARFERIAKSPLQRVSAFVVMIANGFDAMWRLTNGDDTSHFAHLAARTKYPLVHAGQCQFARCPRGGQGRRALFHRAAALGCAGLDLVRRHGARHRRRA